jgi:hypothetical protein
MRPIPRIRYILYSHHNFSEQQRIIATKKTYVSELRFCLRGSEASSCPLFSYPRKVTDSLPVYDVV